MSSPARPYRLTDRRRIAELFDRGVRAGDRSLMVIGLANGLDRTRLAAGVSRRAHGTAVRRNRLKRLCREAFRQAYPDLPVGVDLIMLPRAGHRHAVADLAAALRTVTPHLARKIEKQSNAPGDG